MAMRKVTVSLFLLITLVFISIQSFSQIPGYDYNSHWEKADSSVKKGLTSTAYNLINQVYKEAKKENNQPQIIKSLLYKNVLAGQFLENSLEKMIDTFSTEMQSSSGVEKSILQSITAQMYQRYFNVNRYKIYRITQTENFQKKDIATWSAQDFYKKISGLYLASISDPELKGISLKPFEAIIDTGNAGYLRPTLFDLLAHRALDYFKNTGNTGFVTSSDFEIDDPIALSDYKTFAAASFTYRDSLSALLNAIYIFQKLIRFHADDINPLIDVDIERIQFIFQNGVFANKDSLYESALKKVYTTFQNDEAAHAGYLLGQFLYQQGKETDSGKLIKEAVWWLKDVVIQHSRSRSAIESKNLLAEINSPELSLKTAKVNIPDKPFLTFVSFRNTNQISLRLVKITKQQNEEIYEEATQQKRFQKILSLPVFKSWNQDLPLMTDYLSHSVEIKTDALPVGEYLLIASKKKDFSLDSNVLAAQHFYVSNISYIQKGTNYFVLNRTSGDPLQNAKVEIWESVYNPQQRKSIIKKSRVIFTDKNGFFSIENTDSLKGSVTLNISTKKDYLFMDNQQGLYVYNPFEKNFDYDDQKEYDEDNARLFFFTDRSIYRPGQTVYFKGIGVTKNYRTLKNQLLKTSEPVKIYLNNANGESIDSLSLSLNDYGSLNGKFKLPLTQLTGEFSIEAEDYDRSEIEFSVEEYKRPKFFAGFEKTKGTYKVNDTITVTGNAMAYSGNPVDGASVTYAVRRIARFPYPWRFWRKGIPRIQPVEITHGETTTDEKGNFTVTFPAIPDKSLNPETDPIFNYEISADITDINGETHSTETDLFAGYKSLDLLIQINNKQTFFKDSLKQISITSKNLSGEPVSGVAETNIYKLKSPDRFLRERWWEEPDTTVMPEKEFHSFFPNDPYRDEDRIESRTLGQRVITQKDSINGSFTFHLDKPLEPGWYLIETTSEDPNQNGVKDKRYFQIVDPFSKKISSSGYFAMLSQSRNYEPGETAKIFSGFTGRIHLIEEMEKNGDSSVIATRRYFDLKNKPQLFSYPIDESDRGGFRINQFFVKNNRFYSFTNYVVVPWNNKMLEVSFDTYREKTLPGSKETWKLTIKEKEGNKVSAEMLASMYDASLDQLKPHSWQPLNIWPYFSSFNNWSGNQNFVSQGSLNLFFNPHIIAVPEKNYDAIKYLANISNPSVYNMLYGARAANSEDMQDVTVTALGYTSEKRELTGAVMGIQVTPVADSAIAQPGDKNLSKQNQLAETPLRTNFNETAFFYPDLHTDADGNISFSFTMPDALTKWRLMAFAHTKNLASGYAEKSVITQKDLMVIPNAPRFLRDGDKIKFSAKVVNTTNEALTGTVNFHLLSALDMNPVDALFQNKDSVKTFTVAPQQSTMVFFDLEIPANYNDVVAYRIIARSGENSDGEEAFIPVVTNRTLVTESLPLFMKGNGSKNFSFEKLLHSGKSKTLTNYDVTVEYTSNPVWYAVQALPFLNNYPYLCTEQVFNRYFANALAMHIANTSPQLKSIFGKWKEDTTALQSNLQKNEELKSVLLQETPWLMQAKSEQEQKRNIALLFDSTKMNHQLDAALQIVKNRQLSNGGFSWFENGPDDRFITQYILSDLGHLKKLNGWPAKDAALLESISSKAVQYMDARATEDYHILKKFKLSKKGVLYPSPMNIYYLYSRSFFPEMKKDVQADSAFNYFFSFARKNWLAQRAYIQGMIALVMFRNGDVQTAKDIVRSLKERAIVNDQLGMYWKEWNNRGFLWYQAPVESQALMIEVFSEITKDENSISEMKTWLLRNKQTNQWPSTKATAEAVYALLLQGKNILQENKNIKIKLGETPFDSREENREAGTGYFKERIDREKVNPEMGKISVTVSSENTATSSTPSWGAVYWQYFEDLDKITSAETPLKLAKKLFIEKNTDRGPVLFPVNEGDTLHVGDKIKVRIELRSDRDMEYVHMKDMRASCMEPANVLSGYKWQGGLGYYESTLDVSTNFFFDRLPKGTYVFEYPMFVTHSGNFSNGITTIQCMYAPEFAAHSEGVRVVVK